MPLPEFLWEETMQEVPQRMPGERGFTFLLFLVSLCLLYFAYGIAGFESLSSAGALPLFATSIMVVTSASAFLRSLRGAPPAQGFGSSFFALILPPTIGVYCLLITIYALAYDNLGFLPSSFAFLVAGFFILHRRGIGRSVALAFVLLVPVYLLFKIIFEVQLPSGIVPERELIGAITDFFTTGAKE
jgi:putative tricarboxylic transport membrane protein